MTEIELIKQWLKYAFNDLFVAKKCLAMRPKQTEIACYHCQQSAEKALKGSLLFHKIEPPRTHNLIQLCQMCMDCDAGFTGILNSCAELNSFSTIPRYPDEAAPDESIAKSAISDAQKVYDFCAKKITK